MRSKIVYFLTLMILLSIPSYKVSAAEYDFGNVEQTVVSSSIQPREILTYKASAWTEDGNVKVQATITVQESSKQIVGIQDAKLVAYIGELYNIVVGPATIRNYGSFATVTVTYENRSGKVCTSVAYIYP